MSDDSQPLSRSACLFIRLITVLGTIVFGQTVIQWESPDLLKFGGFLMVAIVSSGMRISVPGITGTLSLTFLFVLFGVVGLTASETVVLGSVVTLIQCYWNQPRAPRPAKVIFNICAMALAIALTERVYQSPWLIENHVDPAIRLAAATCTLFLMNTVPVALMTALAEERPIFSTWREGYFWSLPYYLV